MRGRTKYLMLLLLVLLAAAARQAPTSPTPADLTQGKKVYNNQCALCHGIDGVGGRGPSLTQPKMARAQTQDALVKLIQEGIPGTEMSAFWMLNEKEVLQVAAYVRSLSSLQPTKLPGDGARGKIVYNSKGKCAGCHMVGGEGGVAGPELTDIGARRSAAYLREALLDPKSATPDGFLIVALTTANGERVRGLRVNEDPFTIQLRDARNRFHSFRKSDLQEIKKEFGVSTMPSYKDEFSAAELEDLIAYLASLRGDK